ncbi:MAG: SIS domain-containing protein [Nitrososphaeraceae archaeon]|nr:SIS domain-containing protein [Nitrososphaeraceae archaeon]
MNSIELMKKEIEQQVGKLKITDFEKNKKSSEYLFVGSGDSFVSGLIASYESNFNCLCMDPTEIICNPTLSKNKRVCFISISGKTKENILAAKKVKQYCKETIAITANPTSDLAKNCMKVINLDYQKPPLATAGTLGFILTTMTAVALVKKSKLVINTKKIYEKAEELSHDIIDKIKKYFSFNKDNSIFFLGTSTLFPISCYGSLKINEVLGLKSSAFSVEYFCHSPLFSLTHKDILLIFSSKNQHMNKKANKLNYLLNKQKFYSFLIEIPFNTNVEILFFSSFFVQLLVYGLAKEKKLKDCYFLENKELLEISSNLIY